MMKTLTVPTLTKLALGGGVAGLLGLAALGATPVLAATASPAPAASPATPGQQQHNDTRRDRRQIRRVVVDAEAQVLGIKAEELRADLKAGKNVSELAQAKGITKDQFADRLATAAKPGLDKLVDTHKITAAQEQLALQRIRAGHIPFWSRPKASAPKTS